MHVPRGPGGQGKERQDAALWHATSPDLREPGHSPMSTGRGQRGGSLRQLGGQGATKWGHLGRKTMSGAGRGAGGDGPPGSDWLETLLEIQGSTWDREEKLGHRVSPLDPWPDLDIR